MEASAMCPMPGSKHRADGQAMERLDRAQLR